MFFFKKKNLNCASEKKIVEKAKANLDEQVLTLKGAVDDEARARAKANTVYIKCLFFCFEKNPR